MRHSCKIVIGFCLSTMLAVSCSDTNAPLSPTDAGGGASTVVVTATASSTSAQPVSNAFCPAVAPFTVPVGVLVQPTGNSTVVVTSVRMVFTDTAGFQAPAVTIPMPTALPAPGPTAVFGTVIQGGTRFPLSLGIGCGTGTRGTIVIIVETSDSNGRRATNQVTIAVK